MKDFINQVRTFAYSESKRTGSPLKQHVDLSTSKAINLATKLGANTNLVEAGSLLMDCVIGRAIQEDRVRDHVQMCLDKTTELLNDTDLSQEDKKNIEHCVLEHHGTESFYSLESEICCNADCYRFASIKGFFYTIRYLREMSDEDLFIFLRNKFDEKQNALSLQICKDELSDELQIIDNYISKLEH